MDIIPPIDRLLTIEEVAHLLGIKPGAVRMRIHRRRIPSVKDGRWNRVLESQLRDYIASLPRRNGKGSADDR